MPPMGSFVPPIFRRGASPEQRGLYSLRHPAGALVGTPMATTRASRRTGHAVIAVDRPGRPPHRCRVTLKCYRALREWVHPWKCSGAWLKSSLNVSFWAREVPTLRTA
jgi:hypothetical protein